MKQVSTTKNSLVLSSPRHHSNNLQTFFSKYRFVILITGFLMLATSCQKEELQGNSQNRDMLNSSQNQHKKAVPFKGKFQSTEEVISPTHAQFTGTGEASHIGKFTLVDQVYFDNSQPNTSIITAANGDQIFYTFSATAIERHADGTLLVTNYNIITGGTGRFSGATGNFISLSTLSIYTTTGTDSFEGTISY